MANPHETCGTCIYGSGPRCTSPTSYCNGSKIKHWNACGHHTAPMPSRPELSARLAACAVALDHLRAKAANGYKAFYADRAAQCRAWNGDVRRGDGDIASIARNLSEFERICL